MMENSFSAAERVRVVVRVRPRNEREQQQEASAPPCHHVLQVDDAAGQIYVCKKKGGENSETDRELRCSYDRVFSANANQQSVFEYLQDSVQQVAQGYNCTIFAYGQTGTGKTHTMLGKDIERHIESLSAGLPGAASSSSSTSASLTSREGWGVIPRAVESLFEELRSIGRHGAAAIVYCSYMQIYNNDVYDLLQENRQRMKEPLAVREMIKGNGKQIYVSGLSEFRVTSLDETLRLLKTGNRNRTIRATEYNEKSSRSHALLQLSAEVESRGVEGATTIIRRAKLNLVDLAGSEKWDTDVSMGMDRCRELTAINQSLSALGNVISALTNSKRTHIPYRDSKLTRLLQDSLGGNTRTVVVATISPSETALDETISTLQFADRAKCVMLRVKVNEMVDDAVLLARAQREIAHLKVLLKQNASQQRVAELEEQVVNLTRENAVLLSENKRLRKRAVEPAAAALNATPAGLPPGVDARQAEHQLGRREPDEATALSPPLSGVKRPSRVIGTTMSSNSSSETAAKGVSKRVNSEKSASSLTQLRLDLLGPATSLGTAAAAAAAATTKATATTGGGKPKVITAFVDKDDELDLQARLGSVEREHERLLHAIQTERRDLEQQLEQLSLGSSDSGAARTSTARNNGPATNDSHNSRQDNDDDDDDVCPMCKRNIDDHSDAALDVCIEREEHEMKMRQRVTRAPVNTRSSGSGAYATGNQQQRSQDSDDANAHSPRDSRIELSEQMQGPQATVVSPTRADRVESAVATVTPRRVSTSAGGGSRPSPYAQEQALKKPSTPSSQLKSKPFTKRRSLREGGAHGIVNSPGVAGASGSSAPAANATTASDSSAAGAPSDDGSATATHSATESSSNQMDPQSEIPILRQGHKSVKALKKFHAASPYNLKPLKRSAGVASDRKFGAAGSASTDETRRHGSEENPNCPTTDANPVAVTNSMRDIGLKLTVYKFRYDCWYPCTVVGFDGKRKLHCCQFEYGDKQWQDLRERKIQVVGRVGLDDSDE